MSHVASVKLICRNVPLPSNLDALARESTGHYAFPNELAEQMRRAPTSADSVDRLLADQFSRSWCSLWEQAQRVRGLDAGAYVHLQAPYCQIFCVGEALEQAVERSAVVEWTMYILPCSTACLVRLRERQISCDRLEPVLTLPIASTSARGPLEGVCIRTTAHVAEVWKMIGEGLVTYIAEAGRLARGVRIFSTVPFELGEWRRPSIVISSVGVLS